MASCSANWVSRGSFPEQSLWEFGNHHRRGVGAVTADVVARLVWRPRLSEAACEVLVT